MIGAIVFDFDGVLVRSNAAKQEAFFTVFEGAGPSGAEVLRRVLAEGGELDRREIVRAVLSELNFVDNDLETRVEDHVVRYNDICEPFAIACDEIPGATRILQTLSEHYALYLNSATPEEPLRRIVTGRGWDIFFKGVFGRPRNKPDILRLIAHREGIPTRDLLFVGDGEGDLAAAEATGSHFIGLLNSFNQFDPTRIRTVRELFDLPLQVRTIAAQPARAPSSATPG